MFVHTVYWWLKAGLTAEDKRAFEAGVATLPGVPGVDRAYRGRPAPTNRAVIERSYDYGMTLVFPDQAAQDAYQSHPIHLKFVEDCARYWDRVVVYDVVEDR